MRKHEQRRSKKLAARVRARQRRMKSAETQLAQNVGRVRRKLGTGNRVRTVQAKRLADRLKLPEAIQRHLGLFSGYSERYSHPIIPLIPSPPMPSVRIFEPLLDRLLRPAPLIFPIHLSDDRPFKGI